jgi:hypothetical protein
VIAWMNCRPCIVHFDRTAAKYQTVSALNGHWYCVGSSSYNYKTHDSRILGIKSQGGVKWRNLQKGNKRPHRKGNCPCLLLIKHHAMKMCGGVEMYTSAILHLDTGCR